ncbi:MAG: hypothetical protein JO015_09375 [Verrucomicrobia bacterium]|nr:hypothetical protein [Verrucomicrobiota bacterium]
MIEPEVARRVVEQEKGALPAGVSLGCRLRFLTNGLVLGSRRFVEEQLSFWRGPGQPPGPGAESAGAAEGGGAEWFVCWRGRAVPARAAPG